MKEIGKEYLHEELVYVPAKIFRRQHFAQVVRCPDCGEYTGRSDNEKSVIIKAGHPARYCRKAIARRSFRLTYITKST